MKMMRTLLLLAVLLWSGNILSPPSGYRARAVASAAKSTAVNTILEAHGKPPLSLETNQGQADGRVKFLSRRSSYSSFLTATP